LNDTVGWLVRNGPIRRGNGAWLLPVSGRVDGGSGSFFLQTTDHGNTWTRSGVIPGGSQPTVIERDDGTLLALMRNYPRILRSASTDGGKTWETPQPTALKNPGAGIAMTKLRNGHVVLVFNDTQTDRSPLSIARSLDGGETWETPLHLESNPGEYSYPCVIQTADGKIHVTYTFRRYTIKHVELNEDWLVHLDRPN
jgi:predicted neuraminidase